MTRKILATIAAAAALVAGCGDDTEADTPEDAVEATTTTATSEAGEVEVTAVDYRFEGLPDEVPAGTAVSLRNDSTTEVHELVAMRLPDDEARGVEELLALPEAELGALFAAPPALVAVAPPGEDGFVALGEGTLDDPGRYAVLCFIPTGADPQAYLDALEADPGQPPVVDGGPPHFTQGMFQEVAVS